MLTEILDGAPDGTAATLAALACAESLTDSVAISIYHLMPIRGVTAQEFVSNFKYSGMTAPRNSEWSLRPALRQSLVGSKAISREAKARVHSYLLGLGQDNANRERAGSEVPSYLFTEAGQAYHYAGAGDLKSALVHYSAASNAQFSGAQWLGAKFAQEQERTKVIPEGEVETTFLRAWVLFQEGNKRDALPLFAKIAATDRVMREVAISLHMLGNENNRRQRHEAEGQFLRSIEIRKKIGDEFGIAHSLHSLGNLLSFQKERFSDTEAAYDESIRIGKLFGKYFHVAQTLHSLGNLLSPHITRAGDAETAYNQSIELRRDVGDEFGLASTLHSLGNFLARQQARFKDAEDAYDQSIKIGKELGLDFHVASTLHSLGNFLSRQNGRQGDAELAYSQSIAIGKRIGNEYHLAQTWRSLGKLLSKQDGRMKDAEEAFAQSMAMRVAAGDEYGMALTLRSYAQAVLSHAPDQALGLFQRALDIFRRLSKDVDAQAVEGEMRKLRSSAGTVKQGGGTSGKLA